MAAALLTAIVASVGRHRVRDLSGTDGAAATHSRLHISIGIFSTMICLFVAFDDDVLFSRQGKSGEGGCGRRRPLAEFERRIASARKPVFSIGTYAMLLTIVTGLMGASVDTGMLPAGVHGVLAYSCLALNLMRPPRRDQRPHRKRPRRRGSQPAAE